MAEENGKLNGIVDEIKEKVEDVVEDVKEKIEDIKENAPEMKEEFNQKVQDVKEDVKEAYEKASIKAQEKLNEIKEEIDDYTSDQDPEDVQKNKLMAVLAYIGILVIIPIICAKDSKFAKFHANQGLILCILEIICSALCGLKLIGWIFRLLGVVAVVMAVIGIVYAIQGKAKELPVIGNWTILK